MRIEPQLDDMFPRGNDDGAQAVVRLMDLGLHSIDRRTPTGGIVDLADDQEPGFRRGLRVETEQVRIERNQRASRIGRSADGRDGSSPGENKAAVAGSNPCEPRPQASDHLRNRTPGRNEPVPAGVPP